MQRLCPMWEFEEPHGEPGLRLFVDDVDLVEIVRIVEAPDAQREGHPCIAGSYAGLVAWRLRGTLIEHFLGGPESHMHCGPHEKTVLLGCRCGDPGCWPLMARVEVTEDTVRWSDFEQPHRRARWSYDALGPFAFERSHYETALAQAEEDIHPIPQDLHARRPKRSRSREPCWTARKP